MRLTAILGIILRISIICYSVFQDHFFNVKYTDIDYSVLTDAAGLVYNDNSSPFRRTTYRYSPIYSYLFIPNYIVSEYFGKFLMVLVDIVIGVLLERLLLSRNKFK